MSNHVLFYGWNRPNPGYEKLSLNLFQDFTQFLGGLQQDGTIDSFETVLLNAHGGDLNGFTVIRGDVIKLQEAQRTEEWIVLMTRASLVMDGGGLITGVTGELVMQWLGTLDQSYSGIRPSLDRSAAKFSEPDRFPLPFIQPGGAGVLPFSTIQSERIRSMKGRRRTLL